MLKVDLHVHTPASDGITSLDKLIEQAKKLGLDAVAVCDHNRCTELPDCEFCLIPATEISTTVGHVLGLFVREIDFSTLRGDGLPTGQMAIDEIHRKGGLAVLAHPFELPDTAESDIAGMNFDFIEASNSRASLKVKNANELAADFAMRQGKPVTGGSDAHSLHELGGSYTLVDCESIAELEAALRAGKTEAVFLSRCSWYTKGHTRLIYAIRSGGMKRIIKALIYYVYAILRNLTEKAG